MTHILIVEDDKEICQLYSRVLEKNGYQVTGVANGREALDAIDRSCKATYRTAVKTVRYTFTGKI